jgi:hypothetical protein
LTGLLSLSNYQTIYYRAKRLKDERHCGMMTTINKEVSEAYTIVLN